MMYWCPVAIVTGVGLVFFELSFFFPYPLNLSLKREINIIATLLRSDDEKRL